MKGRTHLIIGTLTTVQTAAFMHFKVDVLAMIFASLLSILPDIDEPDSSFSSIIFSKDLSKKIYRIIIYILNIIIFSLSIRYNKNFIIAGVISFITIAFLDIKLTEKKVRKFLISFELITIGLLLYFLKTPKFYYLSFFAFSLLPHLKHRHFTHSLISIPLIYMWLEVLEIMLLKNNITGFHGIAILGTISFSTHILLDMFTKMGVPLFFPISDRKISLGFLRVGSKFSNIVESLLVFLLFIFTVISLYTYYQTIY